MWVYFRIPDTIGVDKEFLMLGVWPSEVLYSLLDGRNGFFDDYVFNHKFVFESNFFGGLLAYWFESGDGYRQGLRWFEDTLGRIRFEKRNIC